MANIGTQTGSYEGGGQAAVAQNGIFVRQVALGWYPYAVETTATATTTGDGGGISVYTKP